MFNPGPRHDAAGSASSRITSMSYVRGRALGMVEALNLPPVVRIDSRFFGTTSTPAVGSDVLTLGPVVPVV